VRQAARERPGKEDGERRVQEKREAAFSNLLSAISDQLSAFKSSTLLRADS
jgi:hypothetical protein